MLDIYQKERSEPLEKSFKQPGAVFRGTPFWSWNTKLDKAQLLRQIDILKEMGLGGFHMHARVGLDTEYLGPEFMDCVKACVEKAKSENMLAWLYDEDRWPSGSAGGIVTKELQYRARQLLFLPDTVAKGSAAARVAKTKHLASYAITIKDECLASYRMVKAGEKLQAGETGWSVYLELQEPSTWYNEQTYLDNLNPKAVAKFAEVTHECYKKAVGKDFGGAVPAIFTDEPQFTAKGYLASATEEKALTTPYTDDFPQTYQAAYGVEFLPTLPELFWELPDNRYSVARYRYHDHVAERFACAFADTLGAWCEKNNICLTGHMMSEESMWAQTSLIGEAMRSYRSFQLPGIDLLCDAREYTTAKQAQSAAHQYGRGGVLSELYGVTGWDYDFAGHKSQGDWQAALGITVRVQHLSWVSMKGEAKRDYPASIFYQSPWYKRYPIVEDHFARLNATLTRGKPHVRIGLLHPIESYWLVYNITRMKTILAHNIQDENFEHAIQWLLFGQLDFDYISEALLPKQCPLTSIQPGHGFKVGEMEYEVIVVPPLLTMRSTTLERLKAFAKAGGRIIFGGTLPTLVDAQPSDKVKEFAASCEHIEFYKGALLEALAPQRDVNISLITGGGAISRRFDQLIYQMRQEGKDRYLFITDTERRGSGHDCLVSIKGEWALELLDTHSGGITPIAANYINGQTQIEYTFFPHGHLLLRMQPGRREQGIRTARQIISYPETAIAGRLPDRMPVSLSEPNTLLLNQAEWRVNGGAWQPKEEILRIGNLARTALGLTDGGFSGAMTQPWAAIKDNKVYGTVELRFKIESDIAVKGAKLATELATGETLSFDGHSVTNKVDGWWVDESIETIALPDFPAGTHELILTIPLQKSFSLEWSYLLGNFGVTVAGRNTKLTAPVRELNFGDITHQGLPFYTGNVIYHSEMDLPADDMTLGLGSFRGAMVDVTVDGVPQAPVAYAPYRCKLSGVKKGKHKIELLLYGTRGNAFNPFHRVNPSPWVGPDAWRTSGDNWQYEYKLLETGILRAPVLSAK